MMSISEDRPKAGLQQPALRLPKGVEVWFHVILDLVSLWAASYPFLFRSGWLRNVFHAAVPAVCALSLMFFSYIQFTGRFENIV